mgnify:CR=1 FL=1
MKLNNTITEEIVINRDIDWLFNYTQNFNERKKWDKQTLEIDFFDDSTELKKGAKVYTKSIEGILMKTEYLTFQSPDEISIKMLNKSAIFKNFLGKWNYFSTDNGGTKLKITYQFRLRFPYSLITNKVSKRIRTNMSKKLYFLEDYLNETENKTPYNTT